MKIRVLLADDENAFVFTNLLSMYNGFEFITVDGQEWVTRGTDAVQITREERPDIILMDIRMPIMDGLEAIRQIREFDVDVPIIAFSAYTDSKTRTRAQEAGANAFFVKPPDYRRLHQQMCELVAERIKRQGEVDAVEHQKNLQKLMAQYQRNLAHLEQQRAKWGMNTPVSLINEIEQTLAEINTIKEQLALGED